MGNDRDVSFKIHSNGKDSPNTNIQACKSDNILKLSYVGEKMRVKMNSETEIVRKKSGDYHRKCELDDFPMTDISKFTNNNSINGHGYGDNNRVTITNSELDRIEINVFKNLSQHAQLEKSSMCSLESDIKLFRTTVQEILDNFFTKMSDYQQYKEKFNEILQKNRERSVTHMEEFIKDMIQHIMSSESVLTNKDSRKTSDIDGGSELEVDRVGSNVTYNISLARSSLTDNQESINDMPTARKESVIRLFLVDDESTATSINRILASEVHLKEGNSSKDKQVASTEDFRKITSKKIEVEKYMLEDATRTSDRDIPVKGSSAKKDITKDEDFTSDSGRDCSNHATFLSKFCSYICNKFRKN